MLKITIIDTPAEQKLVLEGRLMEPDISELESAWENERGARGTRRCVVDLRNATFIDQSAERILLDMQRERAQFIACGVFNKHRLERLGIQCKGSVPKTRG
jgi:anti-anti-sigma regulatory factor